MSTLMNGPAPSAVVWPRWDRNAPKVAANLVIPEPGNVVGVVFTYQHDDGHRTAAVAEFHNGVWASLVAPLPARPPSPEFAEAWNAARRFLAGGPSS